MSLQGLFASLMHYRRSTQSRPEEEGKLILKRLQELLSLSESKHVEARIAEPSLEYDPDGSSSRA